MRSSITEELQSISVTSFRLLPLATPALPGRRGRDAASTPTPLPRLISPLGFRNPSRRESYETENHSTAEPCNSTSEGLTAPSSSTQSCFSRPKTSLQPIAPAHGDQQQGKSKIRPVAETELEQKVGVFFLSTRETGAAAASPFSASDPE